VNIVWMSWKDINHPQAGGAEVVTDNLAKRLVADGHSVVLVTSRYEGSTAEDTINGYKVVRGGGRFGVYVKAYQYYKKHLLDWADLVIDECNTLPFMTKFYAKKDTIVFFHMLCREIWFYQLPKYIGWIGYLLEPVYLRMLSSQKVITVSESTKADLMRHGFSAENISIISEGINLEPIANLNSLQKYPQATVLSLGSVRAMKRTIDQVKAFEIAKESIPALKLIIAGDYSDAYGESVHQYVSNSRYVNDISLLGRVSETQKISLMQQAHLLLVTSIKEGWGLVVTEANSQGTPAAVYNVDGLRDSVRDGITGVISTASPRDLAESMTKLLQDEALYAKIRTAAHAWSMTITFNRAYGDFTRETNI
jgi:glycosyltransferase involved in cell wall biosynthesis